METPSQFDKHRADVCQIVDDVFGAMLDMKVEPATAAWSPDMDLVTSVVHFTGAWKGAILLECTLEQAFHMTARFMPVPRPTSMNDDVRDALGELANMLAGNLKSVLTPGESLSMPSVVAGTDYTLSICGGNISNRLAFSGEAGTFSFTFWVTLVEMTDKVPSASTG